MLTSGDWIDRWQNEAERNLRIILEEFRVLNTTQLNYSSHIQHCTIMEIFMNLSEINEQILCRLESDAARFAESGRFTISAQRMFIIRNFPGFKCRKSQNRNQKILNVFEILISQHQRLKSAIVRFSNADLNKKINLSLLFGIFKLSAGESIELLLYNQWQHIIQARSILMVH